MPRRKYLNRHAFDSLDPRCQQVDKMITISPFLAATLNQAFSRLWATFVTLRRRHRVVLSWSEQFIKFAKTDLAFNFLDGAGPILVCSIAHLCSIDEKVCSIECKNVQY